MDAIIAIQRAVDYIEARLFSEMTPEDIAKRAYLSSYHFQRLFSMVAGVSVGEYIRDRRLSISARMLLEGGKTVTEIALETGYDTPEGYSRAFKRLFGVSPAEARREGLAPANYERLDILSKIGEDAYRMEKLAKRGYTVEENSAIYYTQDMDATAKWFEDVLGWYVGIDARNEKGEGAYGCATPVPGELINMGVAAFRGFHLFRGEPIKRCAGFILVTGIDKLRAHVLGCGWTEISDIRAEKWGARALDVTTPDGSVITFFELA